VTPEKSKRPKRKKREDEVEDKNESTWNAHLIHEQTYHQRLRAGFRLMRGNPDWSE
jgi:hypothetical protein